MRALLIFLAGASFLSAAEPVSVSANGWTVTADSSRSVLEIRQDRLGVLLSDVKIETGVQPAAAGNKWSAERVSANILRVKTAEPSSTTWLFDLQPDLLKISSTATSALLEAAVPAPPDRIVARLIDPQGTPVVWSGTAEVANGYHGAMTQHGSYLPQRNSEVMYFSLGQVDGSGFHALFDRKTDIAVNFSEASSLTRANGDSLAAKIPVSGNTIIRLLPDYFTKVLGVPYYVPFDERQFPTAPIGWSSWTSYYEEVTEDDMVRNADWLADNLKPYGFQYVQLDDGYDRGDKGQHYWIENWDRKKFPHGPAWLASYIKDKGFKAGIWLVPNAYAGAVKDHPDWYVHDKNGNLLLDYNTPTLDSTNPAVIAFLQKLFRTLDGWGYQYYKFDGEHAFSKYVPAVDRAKLHNPSADPLVTYRRRLQVIRDTVGPKTFIEGCPAGTPLNGIGYFNSYFNGEDVYNNWLGMYAMFSSINGNAFLNHLLVYVMPGEGMELGSYMTAEEAEKKRNGTVRQVASTRETRPTGFGVTSAEARTIVSQVALTGVAYSLASVLPELPAERVDLIKRTLPTVPIFPMDLFSRGTADMSWDKFKQVTADDYIHNYPEIIDLKINQPAGSYDVIGVTNWRSGSDRREISFSDSLGLRPGRNYAVFDFWNQKYLGTFKDKLPVTVEPHDTRVLSIHEEKDVPELLGISRHITGSYSVLEQKWDPASHTLSGTSQGIPGEPYRMTFYVPSGMQVSRIELAGGVQETHSAEGSALQVEFAGQAAPVRWSIHF